MIVRTATPAARARFWANATGTQLERKRHRLFDVLGETLRLDKRQVLPTVPSPRVEGYRNRAKMTISSDRERKSALGYFQRKSRTVVDAPDCGVLVPELLETTRRFRRLLNASKKFPFNLRHIDLRCGTDPTKQHLTLVVKSETMPRLPIEEIADACPHVVGIGVNLNPKGGAQVIKGRIEPAYGAREVFVESAGMSLRVSPGSFFQVNLGLLPEIHSRMGEFFGTGDLLVDLYAGVGTHGLALRRLFRQVLCVEGVRSSVADARHPSRPGGSTTSRSSPTRSTAPCVAWLRRSPTPSFSIHPRSVQTPRRSRGPVLDGAFCRLSLVRSQDPRPRSGRARGRRFQTRHRPGHRHDAADPAGRVPGAAPAVVQTLGEIALIANGTRIARMGMDLLSG